MHYSSEIYYMQNTKSYHLLQHITQKVCFTIKTDNMEKEPTLIILANYKYETEAKRSFATLAIQQKHRTTDSSKKRKQKPMSRKRL